MKSFISNNYNYILFSGIIAWFSAQTLKTIINFIITRKFNAERLIGAGGMPSSHSALVCSATVASSRQLGLASPEFAMFFIISIIVMYDAMGVRRAAGLHAKEINKMNRLIEENAEIFEDDSEIENKSKELKEFLGHTPFQVLGGALLGILIALMVPMR